MTLGIVRITLIVLSISFPLPAQAQEWIGDFDIVDYTDPLTDRRTVGATTVEESGDGVLMWTCLANASGGPDVLTITLHPGAPLAGLFVDVRWRFDSRPAVDPSPWIVVGGIIGAVPPLDANFTADAEGATSVRMRVVGRSLDDFVFGLDGLTEALARLDCDFAAPL